MSPSDIFWVCLIFAFAFGAIIGSFLNVVIYRVPAGLSIVSPGSRCPSCGSAVRWYDNIPIVSWFVLGGKCRECGTGFSIRYAAVEALTGLLAVAAWWQVARVLLNVEGYVDPANLWPLAIMFAVRFTLFAFLVVITFIDLDHLIIPHAIALPGIALGLASPWVAQWILGPMALQVLWPPVTPMISLVGALGGFFVIVALFYTYLALRGAEGIGGGDATLMALVGAWLGWPALIFVLFAASVQGVLAAGVSMLLGGNFARDAATVFDDEPGAAADVAVALEDSENDELTDSSETEDVVDGLADDVDPSGAEPVEVDADPYEGRLAVPFGPFIALAALEYALLGPYLPNELNLIYFYF